MPAATPLHDQWGIRQAQIDALRKYADQVQNTQMPTGQMVGKWYARPSLFQNLATAAMPGVGQMLQKKVSRQQGMLGSDQMNDMGQWLSQRPQAGPDGSQPSQQDQINWLAQGMRNPLAKSIVADLLKDVTVTQPAELRKQKFTAGQNELGRGVTMRGQDLSHGDRQDAMTQRGQLAAAANAARIAAARVGRSIVNVKVNNKDVTGQENAAAQQDIVASALPDINNPANQNALTSGPGAYVGGILADALPGGQTLLRALRTKDYNNAKQALDYAFQNYLHSQFGTQLTKGELAEFSKVAPASTDGASEIYRKGRKFLELTQSANARINARVRSQVPSADVGRHVQTPPSLQEGNAPQVTPGNLEQDIKDVTGQISDGIKLPSVGGQPRQMTYNPQTGRLE